MMTQADQFPYGAPGGSSTVLTWRHDAAQLTAEQVKDLEFQESDRPAACTPDVWREWLIGEARDYIAGNRRDAELSARIQPPVGATSVGGWDSIDKETGRQFRSIQWATYGAGATAVDIDGFQDDTGAVDGPHLSIYGVAEGRNLGVEDARRLAQALTEAADELDRL